MNPPEDLGAPTRPVSVDVAVYSPDRGVLTWWEDDAVLRLETSDDPEPIVIVSGNPAGLTSLARHLLTLAHESPDGKHIDVDSYMNLLAEGSLALRVEVDHHAA